MLFRRVSMLLAHCVVALAVMFGGGPVGLGRVFVMFGGLVVFVSRHVWLRGCSAPNMISLVTRIVVKLRDVGLSGFHFGRGEKS